MHPCLNHRFFKHHGGGRTPSLFYRDLIAPLIEPLLLRTSWGGAAAPTPALLFRFSTLHPYLNHHFFETSWGGGCRRPQPPPPPLLFRFVFTGIEMPSCLNHHFFNLQPRQFANYLFFPLDVFGGDAGDVGQTCGRCCKHC